MNRFEGRKAAVACDNSEKRDRPLSRVATGEGLVVGA